MLAARHVNTQNTASITSAAHANTHADYHANTCTHACAVTGDKPRREAGREGIRKDGVVQFSLKKGNQEDGM